MQVGVKELYVANSVQHALELKQGHPEARWLFAGTDVLPVLRDGIPAFSVLIDLTKMQDLPNKISYQDNVLCIGALATHDKIANDPIVCKLFPALAQACRGVGSIQIRHRASIAGNMGNASPAADSVPPLVATGAKIICKTLKGDVEIPAEEFFEGPRKTKLPEGGLITEIRIPIPEGGWSGSYEKVGGRNALTISIASVAVIHSTQTGYRVAYGSVGPKPLRGSNTEEVLNAGICYGGALNDAVNQDINPINDVRATQEYRKEVCCNLVWKAVNLLETSI